MLRVNLNALLYVVIFYEIPPKNESHPGCHFERCDQILKNDILFFVAMKLMDRNLWGAEESDRQGR